MKKILGVVFVVVLAVLASAVSANAQYIPQTIDGWYYKVVMGNQVQMLTADNLGLVHGLTDQLRRSGIHSLQDDLCWNSGYGAYGLPIGGGFYPMYDRQMRPMSRREATATGAVIGAGAGYAIFGNTRGAVGGGVIGAVVGLLTHRGNDSKNVVVTPPLQGQQGVRVGSDGIPVAVGTRPAGTTSPFWGPGTQPSRRPNCMAEGMVTLENQSAGPLRVFKDGQQFEVLVPKEQKCAPVDGSYTGEIVGTVVGSDGLTGRVGVAPAKPQSLPGLILVWR